MTARGNNGEAVHLTREERCLVASTALVAIDSAGFNNVFIVVECCAQSVGEAVRLAKMRNESAGDCTFVLPHCYYKSINLEKILKNYFLDFVE